MRPRPIRVKVEIATRERTAYEGAKTHSLALSDTPMKTNRSKPKLPVSVSASSSRLIVRVTEPTLLSLKSLACKFQRAAVLGHRAHDLIWCATRNFRLDLQ